MPTTNPSAASNGASATQCPFVFERDFQRPDRPSKCTWTRSSYESGTPHSVKPLTERPKTFPTILHAIGQTPMVRLNNIPKSYGIKCEMYAKCEFLNPGGSVKDRIGYRMVEDAEAAGLLKPGFTIIEPTSGNTGVGLAMASAVKGYRMIIVMPEKMSNEKADTLRGLGAEIIRTPTEASFDAEEGLIAVAQKIQKEIPNSIVLNQYVNAGNPLAHYDGTGAEIVDQMEGKVDMVVLGAGTGGTVTGIGRKIKEKCPECVIVAADPEGSILARPEILNETDTTFYEVEGVGYDFIPTVLDHSVVDKWMKINDTNALPMARRLIAEEGYLCGGSSGAVMYCALEAAKDLKEGQRCVVLLPDNIRNYLSKFVSDNWMEARLFKEPVNTNKFSWWNLNVSEIKLPKPIIVKDVKVQDAINILRDNQIQQVVAVDSNDNVKGTITNSYLTNRMLVMKVKASDSINKVIYKQFRKLENTASLGLASRILEKEDFVLIVDRQDKSEKPIGLLTQNQFLDYISNFDDIIQKSVESLNI